jgi:hypothetical protein
LYGGKNIRTVRKKLKAVLSYPQETVFEIDKVFIAVQIVLRHIIEVRGDMIKSLGDLSHFHKFLIVIGNELLDTAHQHTVGIKPVAAVLIYIFEETLLAVVPDKQIAEVFSDIFRKQRNLMYGAPVISLNLMKYGWSILDLWKVP